MSQVEDITARELQSLLKNGSSQVVLIDVRTPEERKVATLNNKVITPDDFTAQKENLKNSNIVTYW